jgi:tetratricopeptide (TPR) repeat protein
VGRLAYHLDRDYPKAREALRAANRARPSDAVLLSELGYFLTWIAGGSAEGLSHLSRAAELDPRQPPTLAALGFTLTGRFQEAVRYADRVITLAPNEVVGYSLKAQALILAGQSVAAARRIMDSAVVQAGKPAVMHEIVLRWGNDGAAVLGEPYEHYLETLSLPEYGPVSSLDSAAFYMTKAQHAMHTDRQAMTVAYCDSAAMVLADWDHDPVGNTARTGANAVAFLGFLATAHACRNRATSRRPIETMLRDVLTAPHSLFDEYAVSVFLANASVFAGQRDSAAAQLERATRPPAGLWPNYLRLDPFYASLRGHPRFEAILAGAPR